MEIPSNEEEFEILARTLLEEETILFLHPHAGACLTDGFFVKANSTSVAG